MKHGWLWMLFLVLLTVELLWINPGTMGRLTHAVDMWRVLLRG
ncbi:MAG: hypothetical protein ABI743_10955 [bacterium]